MKMINRGFLIALLLVLTMFPSLSTQAQNAPVASLPAPVIIPAWTQTQDYSKPEEQTVIAFGDRSHWLQPWRGYQETPLSTRYTDGVGINLNVDADAADAVCQHLAANGFSTVRIEIGWGSFDYDNPDRLRGIEQFEKKLAACKKWGLRPLLLLNGHHAAPCPLIETQVTLVEPATAGARTIRIDPKDDIFPRLVVGRSGLSHLTDYWAAEVLFTRIDADGTVALSRPLPKDLPAGKASAAVLKYAPWYAGFTDKGKRYPEFVETRRGWVRYVEQVAKIAKRVVGEGDFDFEVWNELTFGSNFLDVSNYYAPGESPAPTVAEINDELRADVLKSVVDWTRDRYPGVGVCDGFSNQQPFAAGSTSPPGLAAIGKHPYPGRKNWAEDRGKVLLFNARNALGQIDFKAEGRGDNRGIDTFIPDYSTYFPEYWICAIGNTETWIRDLSPITTDVYGTAHGRNTHGVEDDGSASTPVAFWVTEVGMSPEPGMSPAGIARMRAKSALRYFASYMGKGPSRVYLFAASDPNPLGLGLLHPDFLAAVAKAGGKLPANVDAVTSETMRAVGYVSRMMASKTAVKTRREIKVVRITDTHNHVQFEGDPATASQVPNPHPPLYNRDCVFLVPFQRTEKEFVSVCYVMTRDLGQLRQPDLPDGDAARWDMPEEEYSITLTGGDFTSRSQFRLFDPITGKEQAIKATVTAEGVVLKIPLTDSVRLLRMSSI